MIFSTTYPKFARLVEKRRQPKEATMINRREFTAGVVTTLAAPFVLKTGLRAQVTRLRRDVTKLDPSDPLSRAS
jgi:hypothetical protein